MAQEKHSTKTKIKKSYIVIAILAIIVIGGLAYLQFGGMMQERTAKVGNLVTVNYIGSFENGTVFDTSIESVAIQKGIGDPLRTYEPLQFVVGSGQLIKGFDNAVVGMKAGETKNVTLQPQDAYGSYSQDLLVTVNASSIQTQGQSLVVGGSVTTDTGAKGIITKIENGNATVDFNSPLAGKVLKFQITLLNIKG
ncbi:MAG: peptidylprolyl isomerase [Candidatus Aenigmarchaeota archaeon]|nr:peptidylprolyl isomerase [Candidatus Aenigmarchaeota archaeon]